MTRDEAIKELTDILPEEFLSEYAEAIRMAIKALEKEPCDDVCERFEQYVDIATDIVEFRFSDGTVKRAKRGLYMCDMEKSIRKMLIDQVANEKKQEPRWIPVSERLPEDNTIVFVTVKVGNREPKVRSGYYYMDGHFHIDNGDSWEARDKELIAWMPLPSAWEGEK